MNLLEEIKKRVVVLDGSMGALLQGRGLPHGHAPDLWNLERPDAIRDVHRQYAQAGAQMVLTNTFGASRLRLAEYGAHGKLKQINHAA
ncbi:MAG: homocysteine S-methyltransferase family protein, partial [Nitrospinota bacterium]|nr:homocysteine S-methyltransferase family protein [Nitrospinota bacterium]